MSLIMLNDLVMNYGSCFCVSSLIYIPCLLIYVTNGTDVLDFDIYLKTICALNKNNEFRK